jgi:hypothetical protein
MSEACKNRDTSDAADPIHVVHRDMRELTREELAGVAGGPEIKNEPPPT